MGRLLKKFAGLALGLAIVFGFNATINNKDNVAVKAVTDGKTIYQLVTSTSDLEANKSYILTNGSSGKCVAAAITNNANNRKQESISISDSETIPSKNVMSFTLGGDSDGWTFKTENYGGTAGYLNPTSTTSDNYLKVVKTLDKYAYFSISFDKSAAVIKCNGKDTRNIVRYNSSASCFSCYSSGQAAVYLFKEASAGGDDNIPSISIDDSCKNQTLNIDGSIIFTATKTNADDAVITWSSSDNDIAMIDESTGEALGISAGTATITASITVNSKTYSDSTTISVLVPDIDVEDFVINEENENVSIFEGNTFQLTIFAMPEDHNETFTWASTDEETAKVDQNGLVTGISEGNVTISATSSRTNKTASCAVTILYAAKYSKEYTDVITVADLGVGGGSYSNNAFKNIKISSSAVYEGYALKNNDKTENANGCIQINTSSGAIWTTGSGGIFKSISIDFANTNKKTLTVYGSNDPFSSINSYGSDENALCSLNASGSADASKEYKYIFIRSSGAMYIDEISITWENKYIASEEDMDTLSEFVNDFLDIAGEYNSNTNKGTGNCVSEGWYLNAKEMFNSFLSDDQRMLFMYDDYYANPRARLEAWAYANNDTYVSSSNKLDKVSSKSSFVFDELEEDGGLTIMLLLLTSSSAILGLFMIYKKKKEQ